MARENRPCTMSPPPFSTQRPDGSAPDAPAPAAARDLTRYADAYDGLPFEGLQVEYRRRAVLERLAALGGQRILEVGCGREPLSLHAADFRAWTIVEPAEAFAAQAMQLTAGDPRVRVVTATIEAAVDASTFGAGDFDIIVLSSLLHEVPDPASVLEGVRALCTAGTQIHCNVPNAGSFHRELAVAMGLIPAVTALSAQQVALQQARIFDAASLDALVMAAGFRPVARGGYLLKPFTHAQMQALVDGGTIDRAMLDGLYHLGKKFPALASEIFVDAEPA